MKKLPYKRKKYRSACERTSTSHTKKWLETVSLPDATVLLGSGYDCDDGCACGYAWVDYEHQACQDWCWAAVEVMLGWYDNQCDAFVAQNPGMEECCPDNDPCCECASGDCGTQAGDVGNDDDYMDGCPGLADLEIGDCDLPICCFIDGGDPDVGHFVVLEGYEDCSGVDGGVTVYYCDPEVGHTSDDYDSFCSYTYSSLC